MRTCAVLQMIINLDCRESALYEEIEKLKQTDPHFSTVRLESCALPLGDAIICDDEGTEIVMVERKTLQDLASSIRDGRYMEQGVRLDACELHNHAIFYLIEGDICKFKPSHYGANPIDAKAILSAITSISYTKGFSIYRSASLGESALWLLQTAHKLGKIANSFYYGENKKESTPYAAVAHRIKKDNITRNNICTIMLSQIPGVSTASAMAVCERYSTMDKLIDALRKDHTAIADITTTTKSGSKRRLARTCVNNIHNYLLLGAVETISVNDS